MTEYVLGFLFTCPDDPRVVLIHKDRPPWQRGKWNGVGGKIMTHVKENSLDAMRREFREETGVDIEDWRGMGILHGEDYRVAVYRASAVDPEIKSMEREAVTSFPLDNLPAVMVPNLRWLIPFCFYEDALVGPIEVVYGKAK